MIVKRIAARIFCILLCITALTGLTVGCGEEPPEEKVYTASDVYAIITDNYWNSTIAYAQSAYGHFI